MVDAKRLRALADLSDEAAKAAAVAIDGSVVSITVNFRRPEINGPGGRGGLRNLPQRSYQLVILPGDPGFAAISTLVSTKLTQKVTDLNSQVSAGAVDTLTDLDSAEVVKG